MFTWRAICLGAGVLLVLAAALAGVAGGTQAVRASHTANQVDVCCAWNGALNDSDDDGVADLTYSISGGGALDQATVRAAVEDWETALQNAGKAFELNEVARGTGENFKITMKKGGGVIAGMANRKFNRQGFVTSVTLSISLKAFGLPNDQATIGEITRHEAGHALGLSHADFDDLMDPTVGGVNTISACDVDGGVAANHWKLFDGLTEPHKPHVTHVGC
jgi:hypothetical protein